MAKLWEGCGVNRSQVRDVVERISGGAYEEFLETGKGNDVEGGGKRGVKRGRGK